MSTFDRRDFLRKTAIAAAVTQFGLPTLARAQSLNSPQPLSFGPLKERNAMTTPLPPQLQSQFSHQTAHVNGIDVHYVIGGQGFPVILLHGWPETWYSWRKIMPALAQQYTVIAPDSRGMGETQRTEIGYDASTLADDAYSLVQSLGFQQAYVVGFDLGVSTAYAYAAKYRDAVQRLVILEIPVEAFGREELIAKRNLFWFGLFQASDGLAESLAEGREETFLGWFYSHLTRVKSAFTPDDIAEYVHAYSGRDALRAGFEWYRASATNAQLFTDYGKKRLSIPVLALGGGNSGAGWPLYGMAQLADNVSGGNVPTCGHYIPEEQPEELLRQLNAFFSQQA